MRRLVYLASVGLLLWALAVVPVGLVLVISPAPATPVEDVIEVVGAGGTVSGDLMLTTVTVGQDDALGVVRSVFDPHEDLTRLRQVIPEDVDRADYFSNQREIFDESVLTAAAVGLRRAGREVRTAGDGALVTDVLEGAPAEGALRMGDVILAANGERVQLSADLVARTTATADGQILYLTVRRGNEVRNVEVEVGPIPGHDQVGLGISVQTVEPRIELPDDVRIENASRIGGPSAGLMLALTIYDLFDDTDLAAGRRIAGTGTIDLDGRVGRIGRIEEKVVGASRSGAEIFLAPESQAEAARGAAPVDLEVIAVATIDDAIAALTAGR